MPLKQDSCGPDEGDCVRIVCLTDTHQMFNKVEVPDGDLLLHAGDHSRRGTVAEVSASALWLRGLPHKHKVVLAGNHDFCLREEGTTGPEMFAGMTYLLDQATEIEGLRIYGSPWTPRFGGEWAYQVDRGEESARIWEAVPEGTQLLITHGPPAGIGDLTLREEHAGCEDLLRRVRQVKPLLHLYGHIHEGYGCVNDGGTMFVNGCNCSFGYTYMQPPHVFDWDGRAFQPVTSWTPAQPLWDFLVASHGPPKVLKAEEWKSAIHLGHAVLLEALSDDEGTRKVIFTAATIKDPFPEGQVDPRQGRWPLTFGVRLQDHWYRLLSHNPWGRLSSIPSLPALSASG